MCETEQKQETGTKIDKLIAAMDRLTAALDRQQANRFPTFAPQARTLSEWQRWQGPYGSGQYPW